MINRLRRLLLIFTAILSLTASLAVSAELPEFELILRQHLFYPQRLEVPAGQKFRLIIHNQDDAPEEFDSFDLNREKVLFPGRRTIIYIGPLEPGIYSFFGEFHPNQAKGQVHAVSTGDADAD
ncbi:cupredoxin domain-containing protein [Lacimicrobium alkaliphilum]|uniref:EfeO-type cupredoxin-like domain-containing protein n=1 Tax=Lacimicrobium alkaliphilum TaxID=1526571 RepID=A0A0U2JJ55_9ALTE|nr:cupredoxin domain-containing protein [Lacimicrobium alkaliphilum]ALS98886.1 hypothetical protein AT746_11800 [Lacimicrobium alkaliphilum]